MSPTGKPWLSTLSTSCTGFAQGGLIAAARSECDSSSIEPLSLA
ncbi:MAG: hypothetical protein ACOY0T_09570 [Myxococcota bacterium]